MAKDGTKAATTTETELTEKGDVGILTAEEEKALRMRHGRPLDPSAPLARKAAPGTAAAEKLLEIEAELLRAMEGRAEGTPIDSKVKSKIVRALRKKE